MRNSYEHAAYLCAFIGLLCFAGMPFVDASRDLDTLFVSGLIGVAFWAALTILSAFMPKEER